MSRDSPACRFPSEERELLRRVFGREVSDGAFALTNRGIWHPTPLEALLPGVEAMAEAGWLGSEARPTTILDAGSGDGRVVAALGLLRGLSPEARVLGLEASEPLHAEARATIEALPTVRPRRVGMGDFLDPVSYAVLGTTPAQVDAFLSYPDGVEHALADFVRREAPEAALIVLNPDRAFELPELTLLGEIEIASTGGPSWYARRFAH